MENNEHFEQMKKPGPFYKVQYRARNFPCKNLKKLGKLRASRKIMRTLSICTISEFKENYHHARNFHFKFTHIKELYILYTGLETHF